MENYKNQLNASSGYSSITPAQISDTYLNGTPVELFNIVFNNIPYNSEYCEKPLNFLKLYEKYPGEKKIFTEYIVNNINTYSWLYKSDNSSPDNKSDILSAQNFEKFWNFPLHENTPILLSIFPLLDYESQKMFIMDRFISSSLLKTGILSNGQRDLEPFFKPYHINGYEKYDDDDKNVIETEVNLLDHILFSLIKNKDYELLALYFNHIYYTEYSRTISFHDKYDIITNFKVPNIKNLDVDTGNPERDEKIKICSSITELFLSLSVDHPQLITCSNLVSYYDVGVSYSDWIKLFLQKYPDAKKNSMEIFDEFCQVFLADERLKDEPLATNKVITELFKCGDFNYLQKFLKSVKNTTTNKFISQNIENFSWKDILTDTENKSLEHLLIKTDENFLFYMELSTSPHSSHLALNAIYDSYCKNVDDMNILGEKKVEEDEDYSHPYILKDKMNGSFIRKHLGENFTDEKIYQILLDKPFNKEIRELGYVSNLHYMMNMDISSDLTLLTNDILSKNIPNLTAFNLKYADTNDKLFHLKKLENILEKTMFLPLNDHAKSNFDDTICKKKRDFFEEHTSEQMANIFHIKNGNKFTQLTYGHHYETSDKSILTEILPSYIILLNQLADEEFPDKDIILSQYSSNILNFFENSFHGFSLYQSYSGTYYRYPEGNNFKFMSECFQFITQSGVYTEKEILNCLEQIQKTSMFQYHKGHLEGPENHLYYVNQEHLKYVHTQLTNLFIEIEHTALELGTPQISSIEKKQYLKF